MRVPFRDLAAIGAIDEVPDHATPPNAWTTAQNVTFRDGFVQSAKGYTPVSSGDDSSNALIARPQFLLPYFDPNSSNFYWIYPGTNDSSKGIVGAYNGSTNANITNVTTYPSTNFYGATTRWNGAVVNGLVVLNNQLTTPQMWDRTGGVLKSELTELTDWQNSFTTYGTCAVLRGFNNFFVALDVTDTGSSPNRNPYEIKHSGIVDSYTAPEWVPSTSNRAGSKYIGEGGGVIIDCLPLRGVNMVYTEREAWAMRFVGGNEVFAVEKTLSEYGMLAQGCATALKDGMHFLVSVGDIVLTDGNSANSIIDGRRRDSVFADIDSTNYVNSFVVSNYAQGEIWFCYPHSGATYPDRVMKWNVKSGAWSRMELPVETAYIAFGPVPFPTGSTGTWDTDSQVWDADSDPWDVSNYNPTIRSLMMAENASTIATSALAKIDDSNQFDGSNISVVLQKTGIIAAGVGQSGPIFDAHVDKHVDEIWPMVTGGPVNIRVGSSEYIEGPYSYPDGYQSFDPSTTRKLDVRVNGRYIAVEFQSNANLAWTLDGYDLNITAESPRG